MRESNSTWACHLCQRGEVVAVPGYENFLRVRSDCRPWRRGGTLGVCRECASVVKAIDASFERESAEIYASYDIFHQSDGSEQRVYSQGDGAIQFRSDPLVEKICSVIPISDRGKLLDVGCGKGAFLSAWSKALPGWELEGSELDSRDADVLMQIPGLRAVHTGELSDIDASFDVISMVHVLEHIPHPAEFLRSVRELLKPKGSLFVEVPSFQERAFDLLVADHCSHFSRASLSTLARISGLARVEHNDVFDGKDVTGVFHACEGIEVPMPLAPTFRETFATVHRCLLWLHRTLASAQQIQDQREFGVFGTSLGATWLASSLRRPVDFFVDEDPSRQGRTHLGKPIVSPTDVPAAAHVFMCLPHGMARDVNQRLSRSNTNWRAALPPLSA